MDNNQKIIVGVLGLPIRKKNGQIEYFLTRRHAPKRPDVHNRWQCSGGGLEYGETPLQCLVREFQEELNITPKIIFPYPLITQSIYAIDNTHVLLICYLVEIGDQIPRITDHETNAMGWFTFEKLRKLEHLPNGMELLTKAKKTIALHNL
jgi:8-oxo-dGTP diphosphatase